MQTVTDASGGFSFSEAPVGTHTLTLTLPDYQPTELRGVVIEELRTTQLSRRLSLQPLPGRFSGVFQRQGRTDHSGIAVSLGGLSALTNDNGSVSFDNVTAGSKTLVITAQGYNAQQSTIVIPPNGEVTQPTVTMVPVLGKIVGKIILEGASDFTGIQVTAFNYASETWSTTTSLMVPSPWNCPLATTESEPRSAVTAQKPIRIR